MINLLMQKCRSTDDIHAKLKPFFAGTIKQILKAEMNEHFAYEKHPLLGNNSDNFRNGHNRKTIISNFGESKITVPHDRNNENLY